MMPWVTPAATACHLLAQEWDNDANGAADTRYTWSYDANDLAVEWEVDDGPDGIIDARVTYTYDSAGNRTLSEGDTAADGTIDWRELDTWAC